MGLYEARRIQLHPAFAQQGTNFKENVAPPLVSKEHDTAK